MRLRTALASIGLAGVMAAGVTVGPVVTIDEDTRPTQTAEAVVPSRFQVGIARQVAVGPFEESKDVIRTDIFLIGGKNGMEARVGSVKIEARHLRERFDSIVAGQVYEVIGNGKFTEVHKSGRSVNLSLRNACRGFGDFATEVKLTVFPTVRDIYKGYRPTTMRYFVRGNDINCDDNKALKTGTTPIAPPRKPGGGSW